MRSTRRGRDGRWAIFQRPRTRRKRPWPEFLRPGAGFKNISSKGLLNRRSLGYARDDKGEGCVSMEVLLLKKSGFATLGQPVKNGRRSAATLPWKHRSPLCHPERSR